jgi:hypothetical protein
MQLRWTEEAANDLERIADYLLLHAPDRAASRSRSSCFTLPIERQTWYDASTTHRRRFSHFPIAAVLERKRVRGNLSLPHYRTSWCIRFEGMSSSSSASCTAHSSGRRPSLRQHILRDRSRASRVRFAAPNLPFSRALDPPCALPPGAIIGATPSLAPCLRSTHTAGISASLPRISRKPFNELRGKPFNEL